MSEIMNEAWEIVIDLLPLVMAGLILVSVIMLVVGMVTLGLFLIWPDDGGR